MNKNNHTYQLLDNDTVLMVYTDHANGCAIYQNTFHHPRLPDHVVKEAREWAHWPTNG